MFQRTHNIAGTANDFKTASDIWATIIAPITLDLITGAVPVSYDKMVDEDFTGAYYMRDTERDKLMMKPILEFHNSIKRLLLQKYKASR